MKSVKTKIIILVLCCLTFTCAAIGGTSILNSRRVVSADSSQIMNLLCTAKAGSINSMLEQIEQSVTALSVYAADQIGDINAFRSSQNNIDQYTDQIKAVAINAAKNTKGALTVYIRFNPEFADPESGLFCSKDSLNNEFNELTPTNLSLYDSSDMEHVGWYYEPARQKKAVWLDPYFNNNISVEMISYVIPIYKDNLFIGVVGMDIDFSILKNIVSETTVYEKGYAFLTTSNASIIHHRDLPRGTSLYDYNDGEFNMMAELLPKDSNGDVLIPYTYRGEPRRLAFESLSNGMRFVLTAPTAEIDSQANSLILQIAAGAFIVMLLASFFTIYFANKMAKPLLELNEAAKKIADGDFSISITHHSQDEVGMLAESFRQTVNHLQKYISYINELAYRDPLTGTKNKTAYLEVTQQLDEMIRLKRPEFAVIVMDINGLKHVNDTMGHDYGDMLIADCCKMMLESFTKSPVYRIGGDEFVIILENEDYNNYSALLTRFDYNIKAYNQHPRNNISLSIAHGIALFSPVSDLTYSNVFKRADHSMYMNKAEMKTHPTYNA